MVLLSAPVFECSRWGHWYEHHDAVGKAFVGDVMFPLMMEQVGGRDEGSGGVYTLSMGSVYYTGIISLCSVIGLAGMLTFRLRRRHCVQTLALSPWVRRALIGGVLRPASWNESIRNASNCNQALHLIT